MTKLTKGARMPVYVYKCDNCGLYFQKRRKVEDRHKEEECKCGGLLEKQFYPPERVWGPTRNR